MTAAGLLDTSVVIDWHDPAVRAALPDEVATSAITAAARSYGLVAAAALGNGPHPRTRFADLLIAATAHPRGLDLYTRNIADFGGLEDLIRVVEVGTPASGPRPAAHRCRPLAAPDR